MLSRDEYRAHDATGLAGLVRRGEVSASELLDCAIAEIERLNPAINAVVQTGFDAARADCARLPAGDGRAMPFAGVPFLAKDINVDVAGLRTTHACRFFADAPPATRDSALVRRWRAAGLIVIGRSNTSEFATEFVCEPELYGPTFNPWDRARTPGGSSGGAAAAVAAGMVPMAHASDSGGSIRVPAACCGLFGFKPSGGVIATGSALGPLVGGLNVDHAVTRSVRDCVGLLAATAGPEPAAAVAWADPGFDRPDGALPPLTVGVVAAAPQGAMPAAETAARLGQTRHLLESLGHRTLDWAWPEEIDPVDCAQTFWAAEMAVLIEARATALGRAPGRDDLGPVARWAWESVQRQSAADMVRARARMTTIRRRMARAMAGVDLLMLPVTAEPPLASGLLADLARRDIDAWAARSARFAPYTEIFNLTGQPAMSVPLWQESGGLPLAIQFAGPVGADRTLLALARVLEQARPWVGRRPEAPQP